MKTTRVTLLLKGEPVAELAYPAGAQMRVKLTDGEMPPFVDEVLIELHTYPPQQKPLKGEVVDPSKATPIESPKKKETAADKLRANA